MSATKTWSKRLFVEPLEDRCLLSADPAIAYTDIHSVKNTTVFDLVVMNGDGSNKTVIWSLSGGNVNQKSWSPDLDPATPGYQGGLVVEVKPLGSPFQLWVFDINVSATGFQVAGPRTLVSGSGYNPAWSPRGDLIAFDGSDGLYVVSPEGTNLQRIFTPAATENWTGTSEPSWNPDGTEIAFKRSFTNVSGRRLVTQQVLDPVTGQILVSGSQTTVISELAGFSTLEDSDWSRVGDRIGFHGSGTTLPDSIYIVQAQASGSFSAVPSTAGAQSPTWSPDDPSTTADETDKFLVYSLNTGKPKYLGQILRQEVATGAVTVLAQGAKFETLIQPDWRRFPSVFVPSALMAVTSGGGAPAVLSPGKVQLLLAEGRARWQAAGVDTSGVTDLDIRLTDLPGTTLGLASGRTIWLDDNAAGWGWFVDPTPWEDSEFTTPGDQGEQNRMDLLTVLAHEIGHLLGQEHAVDGVMIDTLATGIRHIPGSTEVNDWSAILDVLVSEPLSKRRW